MDGLEELYLTLEEEREPDTPEYRENRRVKSGLLDQIEAAMGTEIVEALLCAQGEYEGLECQRFFLGGVRFGLELLKL